jgi:hypothetical protein
VVDDRRVFHRRVLPALVLLALAGCNGVDQPPSAVDCAGGEAEPISTAQIVAALRAHGFTAEQDPTACTGAADIVMSVNNTDASEEEGHVICSVRKRPIYGVGFWRLPGTGETTAWWAPGQRRVRALRSPGRKGRDDAASSRPACDGIAACASVRECPPT